MDSGNRAVWLAIAAVLLVLIAALFLFADSDSTAPASQVVPRMPAPAPSEKITTQPQTGDTAKVQQLIDSGQLAPPPGNPDKMFSIASPFSNTAPNVASGVPQETQGSGRQPDSLQPSWTAAKARQNDKIPAPVVKQDTRPVSATPPVPPGEFETPPGVGSTKGGQ